VKPAGILERRNEKSIDVFTKLILSNALFFTDFFVQGSSKNTAAPSVCDIQQFIQNCTFLQLMSGELISFSMIRPSVFVIQFTKGRNVFQQE